MFVNRLNSAIPLVNRAIQPAIKILPKETRVFMAAVKPVSHQILAPLKNPYKMRPLPPVPQKIKPMLRPLPPRPVSKIAAPPLPPRPIVKPSPPPLPPRPTSQQAEETKVNPIPLVTIKSLAPNKDVDLLHKLKQLRVNCEEDLEQPAAIKIEKSVQVPLTILKRLAQKRRSFLNEIKTGFSLNHVTPLVERGPPFDQIDINKIMPSKRKNFLQEIQERNGGGLRKLEITPKETKNLESSLVNSLFLQIKRKILN